MRCSALFAALGGALAMACAGAPAQEAAPRSGPFQNRHGSAGPDGLGAFLKWQWEAWRQGLPLPPQQPTPRVAPDLAFVHANARAGAAMQPAVTWIGHASVLVQVGGLNVLTDPIFSARASPVNFAGPQRAVPPGLALADLPRVDVVLISHNHYDHLDAPSVRALNAQAGGPPLFVMPLGHREWMADQGIGRVVELDWWQSHRVGGVELMLTPVQHWSARGVGDRMRSLWGGYALLAPDLHLYFAGDTGYSSDFRATREHLAARQGEAQGGGFDLALLPIGAYEPRWFMANQHINPAEAVQVHRELGAKRSMGMHWGTFELADEALDEPPRALARARAAQGLAEDDFFVLAIGQTRRLPPRTVR